MQYLNFSLVSLINTSDFCWCPSPCNTRAL